MPVLNRRADDCTGVGDGIIAVNGVVPAPLVGVVGGGTRWLDSRTIVYQHNDGTRCWIETCDLETGRLTVVDPRGANRIEAGGGVWCAWLAGEGYRDSLGRVGASWYPLGVDDTSGDVALCLDYAMGAGLSILRRDGTLTPVWTGTLDRIDEGESSFRNGVLVYRAGRALRVRQPDGSERVSTLPVAGARHSNGWLLGWSDAHGLVVYDRAGRALPLAADGHDYNADLVMLDSGLIAIASSTTAGERPQDRRRYEVNPVLATVNGERREWLDLSVLPDEPPQPVPTFAPMPCRVTVFDEPGVEFPGVFCTIGRDSLRVAEDEARRLGLPIYAYVDDVTYPPSWVPSIPGVEVIPTIQAYPYRAPGGDMRPLPETIASIAATVLTMRQVCPRVAVVLAAYRQIKTLDPPTYNWPLADVLALQAAVWDLCRQAGVHDLLVFVWTRGEGKDGVISRPEFREALARMRAAAVPVPVPSPAPTPASEDTMKARSIHLRSVADPTQFVGVTKAEHGGLLTVGPAKQAFVAYLFDNRWDENQHVELGLNTDVKVMAPGDGGQLALNDRYGSTLVIKKGAGKGWALVATGSPVSLRVGRADYDGADVGQVRTMDPAYPILDWESFEVLDATTGQVLGPF